MLTVYKIIKEKMKEVQNVYGETMFMESVNISLKVIHRFNTMALKTRLFFIDKPEFIIKLFGMIFI